VLQRYLELAEHLRYFSTAAAQITVEPTTLALTQELYRSLWGCWVRDEQQISGAETLRVQLGDGKVFGWQCGRNVKGQSLEGRVDRLPVLFQLQLLSVSNSPLPQALRTAA